MKNYNFSIVRCLKSEVVKEYMNRKFATCNLQELYTSFKEKHRNVNIGFSEFCALKPKWCALAGLNITHAVCVCSAHENVLSCYCCKRILIWQKNYLKRGFFKTLFEYCFLNIIGNVNFFSDLKFEYYCERYAEILTQVRLK